MSGEGLSNPWLSICKRIVPSTPILVKTRDVLSVSDQWNSIPTKWFVPLSWWCVTNVRANTKGNKKKRTVSAACRIQKCVCIVVKNMPRIRFFCMRSIVIFDLSHVNCVINWFYRKNTKSITHKIMLHHKKNPFFNRFSVPKLQKVNLSVKYF